MDFGVCPPASSWLSLVVVLCAVGAFFLVVGWCRPLSRSERALLALRLFCRDRDRRR